MRLNDLTRRKPELTDRLDASAKDYGPMPDFDTSELCDDSGRMGQPAEPSKRTKAAIRLRMRTMRKRREAEYRTEEVEPYTVPVVSGEFWVED